MTTVPADDWMTSGDEGAEMTPLMVDEVRFLQYALHLAAGQLFEAGDP